MSVSMRKLLMVLVAAFGLLVGLVASVGAESIGTSDLNEAAPGYALAAARIAGGGEHACSILDDGVVRCWGRNNYGQLGSATTTEKNPQPQPGLSLGRPAQALTAGSWHSCALLDNGDVRCWGNNRQGQLGVEVDVGFSAEHHLPQAAVALPKPAVAVSTASATTCAVLNDGEVWCWGANSFGQLGVTLASGSVTGTPQASVGLGQDATTVAVGQDHACAILVDQTVHCWGSNRRGQLGVIDNFGTGVANTTPGSAVAVGRPVVALAAGHLSTCALLDNGDVRCWGSDYFADLGTPADQSADFGQWMPQQRIAFTDQVVALSGGDGHYCAVEISGSVRCWGSNHAGALGADTPVGWDPNQPPDHFSSPVPMSVVQLEASAIAVTAGRQFTCALLDTGGLRCWGGNGNGELGSTPYGAFVNPFQPVGLGSTLCPTASVPVCVPPPSTPTPTATPVPPSPTPTPHVPSGTSGSYVTANLEELEAGPGEIRVHGWAFDPDLPSYDLVVHVYAFFDGVGDPVALGTPVVRAADFRPDINRAFDIEGDHGFNRSLKIRNGNHRVCVYSLSVDGAGNLDDLNRLIGCRYVTVTDEAPPRGAFDVAVQTGTSMKVSGWAYDLDREDDSLAIQVFLDGAFFKTITANTSRPDVNQIVQISGDHGFNSTFTVPAGGHQVCLYVVGVDPTGVADGENVLLNVIDKPDCRNT